MRTRRFVPLALLLALAAIACDIKVGEKGGFSIEPTQGKANDEWVRSYALPKGGRLEIVNTYGNIDAFAATGDAVEVTAEREFRLGNPEIAQAELKKIMMIEEVAPDRVRVQSPTGLGEAEGPLHGATLGVNYKVGIPPGLIVLLKTEYGHIKVENIHGQLTTATTNGGLTLKDVSGPLDAGTVNGGVTATLTAVTGDVKLAAVNGGVRLGIPTTADAEIEATAVNGGVSLDDGLGVVTTQKERQRVVGRLNKGGPKITAQVVNGGVRMTSGAVN
jgi:DUF4097 and DUF4098 domain-containing protein YvlB